MMANFDDLFTTPAAPEPPSAPPQLTKEEYAAKKKAERDDLYALADEMAHEIMQDGDAFRGFLDVQARFDRYSPTNALLIYAQNDKATRLRDFDGWKKQGVYVRRHETGISILEAGDSYVTEEGRTGYYYHVKKVFDIAQTDAKRQPQVHYDDRLLLSALISKRPGNCIRSSQGSDLSAKCRRTGHPRFRNSIPLVRTAYKIALSSHRVGRAEF